jgi:HPt (histidine-containing phosphotransfer) domain-containing protein
MCCCHSVMLLLTSRRLSDDELDSILLNSVLRSQLVDGDPVAQTDSDAQLDSDEGLEDFLLDEELMAECVAESSDALDAVDAGLLALEVDPSNLELVREIFRHLHTVKGTSGSLGLAEMERLGHAGENVLGMVRDGELQTSQQLASVLLETVDALRAMLGNVGGANCAHPLRLPCWPASRHSATAPRQRLTNPTSRSLGTSSVASWPPRASRPNSRSLRR